MAELVSPEHLLELLQTGRPVDIVPNSPVRHRLQFCLHSCTWKLSGIELPESLLVAMAQEVVKRERSG